MHPRSAIERYVADGLPEADERALRQHLKACAECQAYYDRQRVVLRALAGDVNQPTREEIKLQGALAARAVFPDNDGAARRPHRTLAELVDRLLWAARRSWALGAAGAVAVVLLVVLVPKGGGDGAMPLAAVVTNSSSATVAGQTLEEATELRALDVIEVPKGGALELALVRGGTLRVFPNSRLALGARGESVALEYGKVWCLPEEGKGGFEVTTSTATVRVLGTSFIVDAGDDKTDVRVVSGSVEVSDSDEQGTVILQKEESTRVERGQRPSPARRATAAADTIEWQRFFGDIVKGIDRGVKALDRAIQRELQKGGKR
ncbi:MAG: FecR domain-containing protein [Deltaproteobacteria bacterium]|nr:FecR domain-containing protein [Deltaproteobacteria bacterium]